MSDEKKADKAEPELVEVVALERGHCGASVREEGERFFVPRARLKDGSTWFAAPDKVAPKPAEEPKGKPRPPGAGPLPK